MDRATYDKLNTLMLSDGSMTIDQFRTQLGQELGADAPLVRQLDSWESTDYDPGQLLSLKSVLRDEVTARTPSFGTMEDTMKYLHDNINQGEKKFRDILFDLFSVQRLHKWVNEYEIYYDRATTS